MKHINAHKYLIENRSCHEFQFLIVFDKINFQRWRKASPNERKSIIKAGKRGSEN
jgi:hypothetical protein